MNLLERIIPNVINNYKELILSTEQTIYMVLVSGIISVIIGTFVGVILVVTKKGNILENIKFNNFLEKTISILRSIPFIILLAALMPLTRFILGNATGTKGAIIPLVIGTIPFLAKQIESALLEIDQGIIEASIAMGLSNKDIMLKVYLYESLPGIIRGTSITLVSLIGLSAMAGSIGGGGLGDFAIRYGYQRYQNDITYITILVILFLVLIIQKIQDYLIIKIKK